MARKKVEEEEEEKGEERKPKGATGPNIYTVVHTRGFPCGSPHGRFGEGWGPITCPGCIALVAKP